MAKEEPEKFREMSRKAALSKARSDAGRRKPVDGCPLRMTMHEWAIHKTEARKIAHKVYNIMDQNGSLPENPIARQAMKTALEMLAENNTSKDRLAIVRTLLEYNLAKPASTQNVNLKTAEDYLDDLAAEDASG